MDDAELERTAWRGIAALQRLVGRHAPAARLTEHDDYVASAVPDINSSLMNAAVPIDQAPLAPHLDEIADFYAPIPKWGAWIDPEATGDADALRAQGLVLDSSPVLMAARLDDIAEPTDPTPAHRVALHQIGEVNDLAYGTAKPVLTHSLSAIPPDAIHAYGTTADDPASVLLVLDVEQDAFITFVATLPDQRGKRLASNLLAHALQDAKKRGRTTTSLQASKLGQGIYARLGYRPLGEVHLYEMRHA